MSRQAFRYYHLNGDANAVYCYYLDHLGTSNALSDANGTMYQFFLNLPFGEPSNASSPTLLNYKAKSGQTMASQSSTSYYQSEFKFNDDRALKKCPVDIFSDGASMPRWPLLDTETGLYYYGARYYDPSLSIWLTVDPLAEQFPNFSPYNYTMNNPINMVDPDGRAPNDVILKGDSEHVNRVLAKIENATEGNYQAGVDADGKLYLTQYSISGNPKMSAKGERVVKTIQEMIMNSTITEMDVVSGSGLYEVGSIIDNMLDIADVEEFDKQGSRGSSSISAILHEFAEQQAKAKAGFKKGEDPNLTGAALAMHARGVEIGNYIDGNRRGYNKDDSMFLEQNGEVTREVFAPTQVNGVIVLQKVNMGKPPKHFKEKI